MMLLLWISGVLRRRFLRIVGALLGVAVSVALLAAVALFLSDASRSMTTRAVAAVPIDWQVQLVPGADPDAERKVLNGMGSHLIDGVIFSPLAVGPEEIAARADDIPMVLLGERAVPAGYDHVAVDSVAASQAMTLSRASFTKAVRRTMLRNVSAIHLPGLRKGRANWISSTTRVFSVSFHTSC